VLATILKRQPKLMMDAMGEVDVLTPLLILDVGPQLTDQDPSDLIEAAIPPLLARLAHQSRQAIPEAMLWDHPVDHVSDAVGQRLFRFDPPARGVLADPLGLELGLHDETKVRLPKAPAAPESADGLAVERPFRRLHPDLPRLQLSLYDSNPLSMFEAHPDKDGNAISLGDKPMEHWLAALREALDLIKIALPGWFEEVRTSLRRLVPVGYLPERHLSASYREAPGVAYLTLCDNPLTIAEAIVHETQHSKVNLLSWVDPIVTNANTCWTESPVRPDLRPLWGVLLAVHAFVPVAALHHRLAAIDHPVSQTERFPRRRAEVLAGNHHGMVAVLENAEATREGARLIREMNHLHEYLRTSAPPPPPGLDIDPSILPPS
jgi:HEXXH motif-containing protein